MVVASDDGTLDSYVCSASCTTAGNWAFSGNLADMWTTAPTLSQRPFDLACEKTSGDCLLVYDKVSASSTQDLFYRVLLNADTTTWQAEGNFDDTTSAVTDEVWAHIRLVANQVNDKIGLIGIDSTGVDAVAWIWSGTAFGNQHELTASLAIATKEDIGVAWERSSGNLMVVAGEGSNVRYNRFTTSWQTSALVGGVATGVGVMNWITLKASPLSTSNQIVMVMTGASADFATIAWSGSAWQTGTEHDAAIDSIVGRVADFGWSPSADDAGANVDGVIVWGTASGSLSFRRFTYPNTYSTASTFTETGTHPWVQLADPPNPTAGDTVDDLGGALDSTFDIGGIRWDGAATNPVSTGDGGITTDTVVATFEAFDVEWQIGAGGVALTRTIADTFTFTDSPTRTAAKTRSTSDTFTFTDTVSRILGLSRSMTDTFTLSDSPSRAADKTRSPSDTFTFTDSMSQLLSLTRSSSDTFTFSDSPAGSVGRTRNPTDTFTLTESVTRDLALTSNPSDLFTFTDTVSSLATFVRAISDSFAFSESVARALDLIRNTSENFIVTDSIARLLALIQNPSDTFTFSDIATQLKTFVRTLSDSFSFSDLAARILALTQNPSDTFTFEDSLARIVEFTRNLSDDYLLSESVERLVEIIRTPADSFIFSDTVSQLNQIIRAISDSFAFSDAASSLTALTRLVSDSYTFTDAVARLLALNAFVSDVYTFTSTVVGVVENYITQDIGQGAAQDPYRILAGLLWLGAGQNPHAIAISSSEVPKGEPLVINMTTIPATKFHVIVDGQYVLTAYSDYNGSLIQPIPTNNMTIGGHSLQMIAFPYGGQPIASPIEYFHVVAPSQTPTPLRQFLENPRYVQATAIIVVVVMVVILALAIRKWKLSQ